MVSPACRRRAVHHLLNIGFTRVCACRVCGLSRTTSRYVLSERNLELVEKIKELASKHPRYGFRRIHFKLSGVNIKAVRRIWIKYGLKLKRSPRKRLKVQRPLDVSITRPNQMWCMDFLHDRLENGRSVRIFGVLDCFTRECIHLRAAPSFPSTEVAKDLEFLFLVHGKPEAIISDNGPEFRALKLDIHSFIQPGKPWQNGYIESFNGKLRDEALNFHVFQNGKQMQQHLKDFQEDYNYHRPHLGIQGLTPAAYKEGLKTTKQEANLQV
jgi:putative transposase